MPTETKEEHERRIDPGAGPKSSCCRIQRLACGTRLRVTGEKGVRFFKQSFESKIKGDLIPEAAVEPLIGELQELFLRHGAGAALTAKALFKPTKDFHTARHTLYSPEENMEIDKVVPVSASVKTKLGRGGQDDE